MVISDEHWQAAISALEAAADDPREPERYHTDFAEALEAFRAALRLTDDERTHLAMHAHYAAEHEMDPRRYLTAEFDEATGAQKLSVDWATRQERHDRWEAVSRALWPGEIWPGGSR